jgi:hypothetical protein
VNNTGVVLFQDSLDVLSCQVLPVYRTCCEIVAAIRLEISHHNEQLIEEVIVGTVAMAVRVELAQPFVAST